MLQKFITTIVLIITLIALAGCGGGATQPPPPQTEEPTAITTGKSIVLADISSNPAKKIKRFQPMADYIAAQLGDFDITAGEVKVVPDMDGMAQLLSSGEADMYFDSLYPAMIVSEKSGAQPILRRWKKGVAEYRTLFFAMDSSGITSLDDLQGKTVAMESNFSTSAYMIPTAHLIEAGLNPVEKQTADEKVAADEVGYIFSDDDKNTVQWVISGKTAAGVVNDGFFKDISEETKARLVIFEETEAIPRHLVVVRPNMDPAMLEKIKTILVDVDKTQEGQDALKLFENTVKFDELPGGTEAALARMKTLYELVKNR